jgi:hypothetical protein
MIDFKKHFGYLLIIGLAITSIVLEVVTYTTTKELLSEVLVKGTIILLGMHCIYLENKITS